MKTEKKSTKRKSRQRIPNPIDVALSRLIESAPIWGPALVEKFSRTTPSPIHYCRHCDGRIEPGQSMKEDGERFEHANRSICVNVLQARILVIRQLEG